MWDAAGTCARSRLSAIILAGGREQAIRLRGVPLHLLPFPPLPFPPHLLRFPPLSCADAGCSNAVLSGLFLHLVRKPRSRALFASGGINLQPGDAPLACTLTRFPNLVSACVHDASVKASTVLTGSELGGYGNDPNFNR